MKFYLDEKWTDREQRSMVTNPATGEVIDSVPIASEQDVLDAIESAEKGAKSIAQLNAYQRFQILRGAADRMQQRRDSLAQTLCDEEGKTIREARAEVDRAIQTMELSGEEAKRIYGEVLPLDAGIGYQNQLGFTLRVPCGIVVAITPFNLPLALVCHKVGPAIAAGNAVILKPASDTPLVALMLVEILLESGLPPAAIQCLTGSGAVVGKQLCSDPRVRKISFTGSQSVGESICKAAGIKRVTMELGSNSPLVVLPDADLEKVIAGTIASGFANAGQVCISAQRMIVAKPIHDALIDALIPRIESIVVGDPRQESTQMGPMVRDSDAMRVETWINEAVAGGAKLAVGGQRSGAFMQPTLLLNATAEMKVVKEELFGPGIAVTIVDSIEQAIEHANDTRFGLSAAVFTQDIDAAIRFARQVDSGNIHINWGPQWRTDLMPYGGLKASGIGKEGPRYAVQEMTESKTVVIH